MTSLFRRKCATTPSFLEASAALLRPGAGSGTPAGPISAPLLSNSYEWTAPAHVDPRSLPALRAPDVPEAFGALAAPFYPPLQGFPLQLLSQHAMPPHTSPVTAPIDQRRPWFQPQPVFQARSGAGGYSFSGAPSTGPLTTAYSYLDVMRMTGYPAGPALLPSGLEMISQPPFSSSLPPPPPPYYYQGHVSAFADQGFIPYGAYAAVCVCVCLSASGVPLRAPVRPCVVYVCV